MLKAIFLSALVFISFDAHAEKMTSFLRACGYGTLGGAAVGLASLAFTDNPSGKMNNVARGASLGLYAGIGYGLFMMNQKSGVESDYAGVALMPLFSANRIQGLEMQGTVLNF